MMEIDLDRLQKRLELWDKPGNPISVNHGLELVALARKGLEAERLEKELDYAVGKWLYKGCTNSEDCNDYEDCILCWRETIRKAVEEQCQSR